MEDYEIATCCKEQVWHGFASWREPNEYDRIKESGWYAYMCSDVYERDRHIPVKYCPFCGKQLGCMSKPKPPPTKTPVPRPVMPPNRIVKEGLTPQGVLLGFIFCATLFGLCWSAANAVRIMINHFPF
jgi:hypothetical protein